MILIKTKIESIPIGCKKCPYSMRRRILEFKCWYCSAMPSGDGYGSAIQANPDIRVTKQRPPWCPLVEL